MLNILKGHDGGGANLQSYDAKPGVELNEGDWVVFEAVSGTLVKQSGVYDPVAQGALYIVYGGNKVRFDSKLMGRVTVVTGTSFMGETDKVASVAIPIGSALTVKDGQLTAAAAGNPVIAYATSPNTTGVITFTRA